MENTEEIRLWGLQILGRREYSVFEFTQKLSQKFLGENIDSVISEFVAKEWLSDERFAGAFVRDQIRKLAGPLKIRQGLLAKGIDGDLVVQALSENFPLDLQIEVAETLVIKKNKTLHALEPLKRKEKLVRFLQGRGFDWGVIAKVLD